MPLLNVELRLEVDVVLARQRARQIAGLVGFAPLDQTRIATATSEIARNAVEYAGGGRVEFFVETAAEPALLIRVRERGPGISNLQAILDGNYVSSSGLGLGITGARRLMDRFVIESTPGAGSMVLMAKTLPHRTVAVTPQELGRISAELTRNAPKGLLEELQQQNQELLSTLQELRTSQAEIAQMHSRELDETNRGVVALYAELDEGTKALKRLSDLKSRFLSEMSHEFRSPLNSIKGLTGFLLARTDGELSAEQEKQIKFIRQATEGLSTLVDDLLDLAKVEAGKATVRTGSFEVKDLFDALQGTIRPMIDPSLVSLIFHDPAGMPALHSDEGKVAQVLRNFLTNAVKFTERGTIEVKAALGPDDVVIFSVRDSGIGIAGEDLDRIFEEYGQIDNPLQKRTKGIGLGLPLTRKLATLLGGGVSVQSEPGAGSTFFAVIPRVFDPTAAGQPHPHALSAAELALTRPAERPGAADVASPKPQGPPVEAPGQRAVAAATPGPPRTAGAASRSLEKVLIVDDRERDRYLIKGTLAALGQFAIIEADCGETGLAHARSLAPDLIFLDMVLPDMTGFDILDRLKSVAETRDIPVVVHTSQPLGEPERERLARGTVGILEKGNQSREAMLAQFRAALGKAGFLSPAVESGE
jgi:signal transduction histidine kinase/CheY-like chemotaxis protein